MEFRWVFGDAKPVIAMLHLKGHPFEDMRERAKREIDIYLNCGVEAVLVENYFGSTNDVRWTLDYMQKYLPDALYGVNVLGDPDTAFELAGEYGAKFIQIDSVCGHLKPKHDEAWTEKLAALRKQADVALLGGVRFKYQPVKSGRSQEEDVALGMKRCDAIVVTGEGTGMTTPIDKVKQFREVAGDYPIVVGAGVTVDQLAKCLPICDGLIVGSWFKENHRDIGDVREDYVRQFMAEKARVMGAESDR